MSGRAACGRGKRQRKREGASTPDVDSGEDDGLRRSDRLKLGHANATTIKEHCATLSDAVVLKKLAPHDYGVEPEFEMPLVEPDDLIAKITGDTKIPLLNTYEESRATANKFTHPFFPTHAIRDHHGMTAIITMADALHITDSQPITQPLIDFHNIVLNIRRPNLSNGKTWLALDSQSYDYFCSRGKIASGDSIASIFSYDYLAMPIFGGFHFSVMIVVNPEVVTLPLDEDNATQPAWLLLYDSLGMHAVGGNAFKNMT
ncbi:unnamed protein product, partial [Closterium sp. NIES-54]